VLHWQLLRTGRVRFKLLAERLWMTERGGKVVSNPSPTLAQRIGDTGGRRFGHLLDARAERAAPAGALADVPRR
jgi:hypothetical protein